MHYLGVDPGKSGGIDVLDDVGTVRAADPMPVLKAARGRSEYDLPTIVQRLAWGDPDRIAATVEKAQPLPPGMGGGAAQFHRGVSRGLWEGLLVGLGISYELVAPRTWQRTMLADVQGEDTKQRAILAAQRLWPGQDWRPSERARKPHDGMCDAALIAEFGRRRRIGRAA